MLRRVGRWTGIGLGSTMRSGMGQTGCCSAGLYSGLTDRQISCSGISLQNRPQGGGLSRNALREAHREVTGAPSSGGNVNNAGLGAANTKANPPVDAPVESLSIISQKLNALKREWKQSSKDRKKQKLIGEDAKKLLLKARVDPNETEEQSVALTLNAAAFFGVKHDLPVVTDAISWMVENLSGCEGQHVALFAHAVAALRVKGAETLLTTVVAPRVTELLETLMAVEVTMVTQAFFRLHLHRHPLILVLLNRLTHCIEVVKVGEIATVLTSLASVKPIGLLDDPSTPEELKTACLNFLAVAVPSMTKNAGLFFQGPLVAAMTALGELGVYVGGRHALDGVDQLQVQLTKRLQEVNLLSSEIPHAYRALRSLGMMDSSNPALEKLNVRLSVTGKYMTVPDWTEILTAVRGMSPSPNALAEVLVPSVLTTKLEYTSAAEVAAFCWELMLHPRNLSSGILGNLSGRLNLPEEPKKFAAASSDQFLRGTLALKFLGLTDALAMTSLVAKTVNVMVNPATRTADGVLRSLGVLIEWHKQKESAERLQVGSWPPSGNGGATDSEVPVVLKEIVDSMKQKGFFDATTELTVQALVAQVEDLVSKHSGLEVEGVPLMRPEELPPLLQLLKAALKIHERKRASAAASKGPTPIN